MAASRCLVHNVKKSDIEIAAIAVNVNVLFCTSDHIERGNY